MQIKDPTKLAEKMLETANAKGSITSKLALSWLLVLVLLWNANLEPLIPKLIALARTAKKSEHATGQWRQYERKLKVEEADQLKRLARLKEEAKTANQEEQWREYEKELEREAADQFERLARLEKEAKTGNEQEKKEAAEISIAFSVPGFPAFNVPTRLAGLVWCALLLGLVVYVSRSRTAILILLGQAARLLREHSDDGELKRPAVLFSLPWWVAPLPGADGSSITASEFRNFIGWAINSKLRTVMIACVLGSINILQIRVASIGATGLSLFGYQTKLNNLSALLTGLCAAIVLLTMITSMVWFKRFAVPDHLSQESNKNAIGRRELFFLAATVSIGWAATSAFAKWNTDALIRWLRSPRYRRRRNQSIATIDLKVGFHLNKRSSVIQYVSTAITDRRSTMATVTKAPYMVGLRLPYNQLPKEKNFSPVPELPLPGERSDAPRLNRGVQSHIIERAAIDSWIAGNRDHACELLKYGVLANLRDLRSNLNEKPELNLNQKQKRPDLRIYYLLAKFAVLSKQDHRVSKMVDAIKSSGAKDQFNTAIASWTNPESRWRKRLKYFR